MRPIDADKLNTRPNIGNNSSRTMWRNIERLVNEAPTIDIEDIKTEVAREIFAEIDSMCIDTFGNFNYRRYIELKNKYIGGVGE